MAAAAAAGAALHIAGAMPLHSQGIACAELATYASEQPPADDAAPGPFVLSVPALHDNVSIPGDGDIFIAYYIHPSRLVRVGHLSTTFIASLSMGFLAVEK
jgi:hypothetical protein